MEIDDTTMMKKGFYKSNRDDAIGCTVSTDAGIDSKSMTADD
jgi:hypothetical protein